MFGVNVVFSHSFFFTRYFVWTVMVFPFFTPYTLHWLSLYSLLALISLSVPLWNHCLAFTGDKHNSDSFWHVNKLTNDTCSLLILTTDLAALQEYFPHSVSCGKSTFYQKQNYILAECCYRGAMQCWIFKQMLSLSCICQTFWNQQIIPVTPRGK